eukprot:Sspe_Gene.67913::Locus_40049_Transcript_1_1_Confidence_1.000_Length_929::g.67913::m.67913
MQYVHRDGRTDLYKYEAGKGWHKLGVSTRIDLDCPIASQGLTMEEAAVLRGVWGKNTLPEEPGPSLGLAVALTPPVLLSAVAGVVHVGMGGRGAEALAVAGVLGIAGLAAVHHTKRLKEAWEEARERFGPHALVFREGIQMKLPQAEIVPGDVVRLGPGEVCADYHVLQPGKVFLVDESARTGEPEPVKKTREDPSDHREEKVWADPAVESSPSTVLSSSKVVEGGAVALCIRTGSMCFPQLEVPGWQPPLSTAPLYLGLLSFAVGMALGVHRRGD